MSSSDELSLMAGRRSSRRYSSNGESSSGLERVKNQLLADTTTSNRPCPHCTSSNSYFQLTSTCKLVSSFQSSGSNSSNNEITSFLLVLVLTSILFTITLADDSVVDEPSLYRRTTASSSSSVVSSSQSIVFMSKPYRNSTSGGGGRSSNSGTSCQSNIILDYDQGLFDELKMSDTLINLYRSCYKDKFNDELRRPLFKTGLLDSGSCNDSKQPSAASSSSSSSTKSSSSSKSSKSFTQQKDIIPKHREILIELLMDKSNSIIPVDVQKRIDMVCDNNDNQKRSGLDQDSSTSDSSLMDYLDKIYLLADYEHDLCGNVFKNSIKLSYLKDYVLKIKDNYNSNNNNNKTSRHSRPVHLYNVNHQNHRHHRALKPSITSSTTMDYSTSLVFEMSEDDDQLSREKRDSGRVRTSLLVDKGSSSSRADMKQRIVLNNCTMILLNLHLLSFKTSCDFEDFAQILQHYDCLSNFSVNSNCSKCQSAYGKWLCSSNLPYYDGEKLSKPCLRYCFNVQNQCPFFRPADHYGGQPVFTCSNVIQATESKPEGYEDDDENYYDDDLNDDDQCYTECSDSKNIEQEQSLNRTLLNIDLSSLFNQTLSRLDKRLLELMSNKTQTYLQEWPEKRKLVARNKSTTDPIMNSLMYPKTFKYRLNKNGRYYGQDECLFNLKSDGTSISMYLLTLTTATTITIVFNII